MATSMQFLVHAWVDGAPLGVFDTWTGGDAVAKAIKHRPGGMGPEKSYVSLPSFSDVTVGRVLERSRDWELERTLIGKGGRVTGHVTVQPLDDDGNAWGSPLTLTGRFLGVKPPKGDSTSDAVAMWECDFAITTVA